ncbi:MAG: DUF2007 domain-containing protein [Bacteroidetes bacterium]|nr:DUF2007 domain-containing protein [Bacteroidota bacterium]MBU1421586.1 DUF2007 domain-containing protein [Bacteroidota bacterium]MBU2471854.1 DUF2007 domain-containing protein [Bacteroidota bacterium]MBU2635800.1 DUF2007 domain-containing protein [Bacteroidota bacterium]
MPYCPNCGYEYVKGITICPDCNFELAEGEPVYCFNCEELMVEKNIFCSHCGYVQSDFLKDDQDVMCEVHPKVEAMGICVICKKAVCSDCAVEKNSVLFCNDDSHIKVAQDWAVAFTTNTDYEAEMIKANLQGAGIPTMVFSQRDHAYFMIIGDMAVVNVMVPRDRLADAEEYLKKMDFFGDEADEDSE